MRLRPLSDPRWLSAPLAKNRLPQTLRLHLLIFGVSIVWLLLVFMASVADKTTSISGEGKGFLEHGGYITLHLASPIALSLALIALEYFAKLMARLANFMRSDRDVGVVEKSREECLSILNLASRWTWLLLIFVIIGALCSVFVLMQVIAPVTTYGNDVFNACRYPFGYYTANSYLALSWTVIFPLSLFIVLQITASLVVILSHARKHDLLAVDLLHADNCGGLSPFGNLNLLLMLYYIPPFLAMSALAATHTRNYASLLVPAAALSLVFVTQSVIGVYAIHLAVRAEKRTRLSGLHDTLIRALHQPTYGYGRELTFLMWQHVRGVKTMPYAANVEMFVTVLRYLPPIIAVYNIVKAQP